MQLNLDLPRFLKRYWQKRPLLMRGALEAFESPIDGHDLAALATDQDALARLVSHDARGRRWSLRDGPFDAPDYAALGERDWTLLVQDVDKWLPEVFAPLLALFDFLPSWRIEDVMVSYAVPGGSVGAHVDQYDVFLLQASGRRRWLIDDRPGCSTELDRRAPLKLLQHFEPNQDWILEPGDILYLPPGVPHHGIAVDNCLTFSVGLRAPSATELMQAVATDLLERDVNVARYRDPPLHGKMRPGEIDALAVKRMRRTLRRLLKSLDEQTLASSLGRFMSLYRAPRAAQPRARPPAIPAISRQLQSGGSILRDPWQRLSWNVQHDQALLHAAGRSLTLSQDLAEQLCADRPLQDAGWLALSAADQRAVRQLLAAGVLQLVRE
jgi:50S ribosomal protein L16 3-hydroxylase